MNEATYVVDDSGVTTLAELQALNEECPIEEFDVRGIEALAIGETWTIGGGAQGLTTIRRVS
jgi:hypothetical protein